MTLITRVTKRHILSLRLSTTYQHKAPHFDAMTEFKNILQCNISGPCTILDDGSFTNAASVTLAESLLLIVGDDVALSGCLSYQRHRGRFHISGPERARLSINGLATTVGQIANWLRSADAPKVEYTENALCDSAAQYKIGGRPIPNLVLSDGTMYGEVRVSGKVLAPNLTITITGGQMLILENTVFESLSITICDGIVCATNVVADRLEIICMRGRVDGVRARQSATLVGVSQSTINIMVDADTKVHSTSHQSLLSVNRLASNTAVGDKIGENDLAKKRKIDVVE